MGAPEIVLDAEGDVRCAYCDTILSLWDGIWVDGTDGDCCWGDAYLNNENEPHRPLLASDIEASG